MQAPSPLRVALTLFALIVAVLILAFLLLEPPGGGSSPDDTTSRRIRVSTIEPVVVNATTNGSLRLRPYQLLTEDECRFRGNADTRGTAFVYDRDGPVGAEFFEIPPDRPSTVLDLPLDGTPPFLLALDMNICHDIYRSRVENVTDGYAPDGEGLWERTTTRVEVTIPSGEQRGNATWRPDPFSWRLVGTIVDRENTTGTQTGTLWFYDGRDVAVCEEDYSLTNPEGDCVPFFLYPSPYEVEVELDRPAARETVWPYEIDTIRFTDEICSHGFTWEDLCS